MDVRPERGPDIRPLPTTVLLTAVVRPGLLVTAHVFPSVVWQHAAPFAAARFAADNPALIRASALRRNAMACVALPTCGLALAESERICQAS
jgi:hypothetical protein